MSVKSFAFLFRVDDLRRRAIFTWIAKNFEYDDLRAKEQCERMMDLSLQGFRKVSHQLPWETLKKGTGTSRDFAALYAALAKGCGLSSKVIQGLAKGTAFISFFLTELVLQPLELSRLANMYHAWNVVSLEYGDKLIDVTLGMGNWTRASFELEPSFMPSYFVRSNEDFRFTHFPMQSMLDYHFKDPINHQAFVLPINHFLEGHEPPRILVEERFGLRLSDCEPSRIINYHKIHGQFPPVIYNLEKRDC